MVFKPQPNKHRTRTSPFTSPLCKFPNELLFKILDNLDDNDVSKVRLVSRALVATTTTVLRSRLRVLYIHPSPTALRRLVHIVASDLITDIQEIALVGVVLWSKATNQRHATYPWPPGFPGAKSPSVTKAPTSSEFAAAWRPLLDRLSTLSLLRRISYIEKCDRPGFNKPSENVIALHAQKSIQYTRPGNRLQLSDFDMLFCLMRHCDCKFSNLYIASMMPEDIFQITILDVERVNSFNRVWAALTTLNLQCGPFPEDGFCNLACERIIANAAPGLKSLSLTVVANPRDGTRVGTSFSPLLGHSRLPATIGSARGLTTTFTLPVLEALRLSIVYLPMWAQSTQKPHRPCIQDFRLIDFLEVHRHTLRIVELDNVIFNEQRPFDPLIDVMRNMLYTLRTQGQNVATNDMNDPDSHAALKFDKFRWTIAKYDRDPRCPRKTGCGVMRSCKYNCGFVYKPYIFPPQVPTTSAALDTIMEEAGALLDPDQQRWVFDLQTKEDA